MVVSCAIQIIANQENPNERTNNMEGRENKTQKARADTLLKTDREHGQMLCRAEDRQLITKVA